MTIPKITAEDVQTAKGLWINAKWTNEQIAGWLNQALLLRAEDDLHPNDPHPNDPHPDHHGFKPNCY